MKLVAAEAGRADVVVGRALGWGRKRVADAFATRCVRVNGRRARKGDRIGAGDAIEVEDAVIGSLVPVPWAAPFDVLHEDARIVAGNKPAAWPSHPLRAGETGTYANALVARYPECASAGADVREAGLVHRLDAGTSGILVAARSRAVWEEMRITFTKVNKIYIALVDGVMPGREGEIDAPIREQEARTRWVAERTIGDRTLVRCTLVRGKMHQVRVHLAGIGHPIVGDVMYGGPAEPRIEGHFLHALRIELPELAAIEAPLPPDRALLAGG